MTGTRPPKLPWMGKCLLPWQADGPSIVPAALAIRSPLYSNPRSVSVAAVLLGRNSQSFPCFVRTVKVATHVCSRQDMLCCCFSTCCKHAGTCKAMNSPTDRTESSNFRPSLALRPQRTCTSPQLQIYPLPASMCLCWSTLLASTRCVTESRQRRNTTPTHVGFLPLVHTGSLAPHTHWQLGPNAAVAADVTRQQQCRLSTGCIAQPPVLAF